MSYNPRYQIVGDQETANQDWNEDYFQACLESMQLTAEREKWDHADYYHDGVQRVTSDPETQAALLYWCEENLLFWKDEDFNA